MVKALARLSSYNSQPAASPEVQAGYWDAGYEHRTWTREERELEVLRSWEALGCSGEVLGTDRLFSEEAMRWLEARMELGES